MLNSDTGITVGNPMSSNEPCVSSGVNLQVLGATDPKTNLANWQLNHLKKSGATYINSRFNTVN